MNPAHVEAVRSIKNAVANKVFLNSKKLTCAHPAGRDGRSIAALIFASLID